MYVKKFEVMLRAINFPKLDIERRTWSLEALNFMKYFLLQFFYMYIQQRQMDTYV